MSSKPLQKMKKPHSRVKKTKMFTAKEFDLIFVRIASISETDIVRLMKAGPTDIYTA